MLAIEMAGCIYCPLSPQDPQHRLQSLVEQIQSRSILFHHLTRNKFEMKSFSTNIDSVLTNNVFENDNDVDLLATVLISLNSIAYIIFTSGSTGTPKAVSSQMSNVLK
jgi:non-ribosomal peptide synthetase component F